MNPSNPPAEVERALRFYAERAFIDNPGRIPASEATLDGLVDAGDLARAALAALTAHSPPAPGGGDSSSPLPSDLTERVRAFVFGPLLQSQVDDDGSLCCYRGNSALDAVEAFVRSLSIPPPAVGDAAALLRERLVRAALRIYSDLASFPVEVQKRLNHYGWLEEFREASHAVVCDEYRAALRAPAQQPAPGGE